MLKSSTQEMFGKVVVILSWLSSSLKALDINSVGEHYNGKQVISATYHGKNIDNTKCISDCLDDINCKGVDYVKTDQTCYFHSKNSICGTLITSLTVNHWKKGLCGVNVCNSKPCLSGGTCTDIVMDYVCSCPQGYSGRNCETNIDECGSNACLHGATCTDLINGYSCACASGFTGLHCETDVDECASSPCLRGSTCKDHINGFSCACESGYSGLLCETDVDECASVPCLHGGNCTDFVNQYTCECAEGYTGLFCETDVDDCQSSPCLHGGTCIDGVNRYSCSCIQDLTGIHCESLVSGPVRLVDGPTSNIGRVEYFTSSTLWGSICDTNPSSQVWPAIVCRDLHFPALKQVMVAKTSRSGIPSGSGPISLQNPRCSSSNPSNMSECTSPTSSCTHSDDVIIDCGPRICPEIEVPGPGTLVDSYERIANTVLTYTCILGYQFEDGTMIRTLLCKESGVWSSSFPKCKATMCQALPNVNSVDAVHSEATCVVGSVVKFRCHGTKRMRDGSSVKEVSCSGTGQWTDSVSDCEDNRCPPLPLIGNSIPNTTETTAGIVVEFSCISGHLFPDDESRRTIKCKADLQWDIQLPSCHPIQCPKIPYLENTKTHSHLRMFGTRTTIECLQGHVFPDNSTSITIECLPNKLWSINPQSCQIVTCKPSSDIPNSKKIGNGTTYGSIIQYTCNPGYRFPEGRTSRTIGCTDKFVWNSTGFDCQVSRCEPVPSVDNATPNTLLTQWWTVVTYSCFPGYTFPDGNRQKQITCTSTNDWTGYITDCIVMSCSSLPVMEHAQYTELNGTGNRYGSSVNVSCTPGYRFYDNNTWMVTTCSADLTRLYWWPESKTCEPLLCDDPPVIENATNTEIQTLYNSEITYSCPAGYELLRKRRNVTIRCTESGFWDHNITACTALSCGLVPIWGNAEFNTTEHSYLTVVQYHCKEDYKFADSVSSKLAVCSPEYQWEPGIEECIEKVGITEDIKKNKTEAVNAMSIGTVTIAVVFTICAIIIILDSFIIVVHIKMAITNLKDCVKALTQKPKNSVIPSAIPPKTSITNNNNKSNQGQVHSKNTRTSPFKGSFDNLQKPVPYYVKKQSVNVSRCFQSTHVSSPRGVIVDVKTDVATPRSDVTTPRSDKKEKVDDVSKRKRTIKLTKKMHYKAKAVKTNRLKVVTLATQVKRTENSEVKSPELKPPYYLLKKRSSLQSDH